jgi:dienelactone hydrolase
MAGTLRIEAARLSNSGWRVTPCTSPISTTATSSTPRCQGIGTTEQAELFLYSGDKHLFTDPSLTSFDPPATALLTRRVLQFLSRIS